MTRPDEPPPADRPAQSTPRHTGPSAPRRIARAKHATGRRLVREAPKLALFALAAAAIGYALTWLAF